MALYISNLSNVVARDAARRLSTQAQRTRHIGQFVCWLSIGASNNGILSGIDCCNVDIDFVDNHCHV